MPGREFYLWQVSPFTVRIALDLVDRLNTIISDPRRHRQEEIGGILLGRISAPYAIDVDGFEFLPSEHHRGTIFALGLREQERVSRRVASLNKNRIHAVGFFRTHYRPGLFLDQDDFGLMQDAFSNASQIAMLVKPLDPKPSNAGIFFWENGELDRRATNLLFPFDSETLRVQGPLEVVRPEPIAPRKPHRTPRRYPVIPKPVLGWSIASVAAVSLVAMSLQYRSIAPEGSHPAIESAALLPVAQEPPSAKVSAPMPSPAKIIEATPPPALSAGTERESEVAVISPEKLVPPAPPAKDPDRIVIPAKVVQESAATRPSVPAIAPLPQPQRVYVPPAQPVPLTVVAQPRQDLAENRPTSVVPPVSAPVERPEVRSRSEEAVTAPPVKRQPGVAVSVRVEARQSSEFKRAVSHVPLFGHAVHVEGGSDFSPPRPSRSIEPRLPEFLAHDLGGPVGVDVRVSIDKDGSVRNAEVLNGSRSSELATLAANAAGSTLWEPARQGDRMVPSDVIVHYRFQPRN